ncbi:DsbA family protein [Christensenellaceae bacterium OttesenSCG-928-K19]|nr:DsbA family protein [Christensenellaceae bacterium OttesenSCG-928-K19]
MTMTQSMEVFFDYACPYCMRAHEYLTELLPVYPQIEIIWRPCESHPRPDRYGPHSDLAIRGMFYAKDNGVNLMEYHAHMYDIALKSRINIEDVDALAGSVAHFMDAEGLCAALRAGAYQQELEQANSYAYDKSKVWVVPAYRLNGKKLDPIEDVGVNKKELARFIEDALLS